MSDDIVNRLRKGTNDGLRAWDWMREAADEITRLRADLAAVTAERDRMREALRPFADAVDIFIAENHDAHRTIVTLGDFFHARAALEGVTEPEIQS